MTASIRDASRLVSSCLFSAAIFSFSVLFPAAATAQKGVVNWIMQGQVQAHHPDFSWRDRLAHPATARILAPYAVGDVFVSVGPGLVKVFDQAGNLKQTLSNGRPNYTATGSAFDAAGNFYVTTFSDIRVSKFDNNGNLDNATFMSTDPGSSCESIVRDAAGNFYVGQADGTEDILKFDGTTGGAPIARYDPAVGPRGTDWIDLAADQRTIYYTSEGGLIRRFDVSTNTQLADFNPSDPGGSNMFALRILPDGGVLVANRSNVLRYNSAGFIAQTHSVGSGTDILFALNRDPDGVSFWTAEISSGNVFKVDIASGAILASFNAGPTGDVAGLSIFGERTEATAGIELQPATDTNFLGETHTVTATVTTNAEPVVGAHVTFTIVSGPNAGATGTCSADPGCNTDANGNVSFSYVGTGGEGTDAIEASFTDNGGVVRSARATKTWERRPNEPPDCSQAVACEATLWPPNHQYRPVSICGVTDPDGDVVTITVTSITQDEPLNTRGDGNTCPDAQIVDGHASVRAERTGNPGIPGNGRVYMINFTADDGQGGTCEDSVIVCVPHDQGQHSTCIDDGQRYSSLGPCNGGNRLAPEALSLNVARVTNTEANLAFALPTDAFVDISVFDLTGRRVATIERGQLGQGNYERTWNFEGVSNGLYFVRMRAGQETLTSRVVRAR